MDKRSSQLHCHRRFITFLACSGFKLKVSIKSSRVSSESIAPSRPFSWNVGARWPKKGHVRMAPHLQVTMTRHLQLRQVDAEELWLQSLVPRNWQERVADKEMRKAMGTALDHWLGNCNGLCEVEDKPALEHHLQITLLQNFLPFNSVRSDGRVVWPENLFCSRNIMNGALSNYSSCRA